VLVNPDGSPMSLHYEALGVSENVTSEDLRQAWRAAARRWHPDHRASGAAGTAEAEAMFKRASDAWAVLRDADLRVAYDEALRVARMPVCSVCGEPSFQSVCVLCSFSPSVGGARTAGVRPPRARAPARPVTPSPPPRAKPRPPAQPNPPPRPRAARPAKPLDPGLDPRGAPRAGPGTWHAAGPGFGASPGDAWDAAERELFEREAREREEMERDVEEREAMMRESASVLSALMGGESRRRKRTKPLSLEVPLGPGFRIVIDEDAAERMGDVNDGLRLASRLFRSVSKFWNR